MITETHLTDDQLEHLMEMCKKLFPEYDETMFYQLPTHEGEKLKLGKVFFFKDKIEFEAAIHWYELCLTYLFDRLVDPEHAEAHYMYWKKFMRALRFENHPVDFLYDLFTKKMLFICTREKQTMQN